MVLAEFGVNLGPILASAGIVGLALGFGAQNLVRDFLSGMFMLLEDQYGVGDIVDLGEASGTVEAVGLRITTLRDIDGTVWYVRNGEILRVGNKSQGYAVAVVDLPRRAHSADIDEATEIAGRVAAERVAEARPRRGRARSRPRCSGSSRSARRASRPAADRPHQPGRAVGGAAGAARRRSPTPSTTPGVPAPVRSAAPGATRPSGTPAPDGPNAEGSDGSRWPDPENFYDDVGGARDVRARSSPASTSRCAEDDGPAAALPGGGPRPGRGAAADVPRAVLGRPAAPTPTSAATHGCGCGTRPFQIGPIERDAWLRCMRIAVDEAGLDDEPTGTCSGTTCSTRRDSMVNS